MSNLVLELRQGEMMIVNGAPIRFRTKSRIELTAKARFLFGKQIMPPDQAGSPALPLGRLPGRGSVPPDAQPPPADIRHRQADDLAELACLL